MCGIVGVWWPGDSRVLDRARAMASTIAHRGPDDEGFFSAGDFAMGMRRLSIVDLAGGHQPMFNEDGSLAIVFNGEIYNHAEIRASLERSGHRFETRSDTEVILHAFEEYGVDCVHRLNGMFAFAIWDSNTETVFLARDRMGVKPLYYAWDGVRLVFASEIKAIFESGLVTKALNELAVWHFLTFGYVPQETCIWKGIAKLPPAHRMLLGRGETSFRMERYWDIPAPDQESVAEDDQDSRFADLFEDAVRLRLIADVPVGILLSGGLDSSAVAAAVRQLHSAPIGTFSVAFRDGGQADESEYARLVASTFGTDHHQIFIGAEEFLGFLPEFVWYADEPLADSAAIPLYFVSQLARRHVKVVLSGEGSDEILGGYAFHDILTRVRRREETAARWSSVRRMTPAWVSAAVRTVAPESRAAQFFVEEEEVLRAIAPTMTRVMNSTEKRRLWPWAPQAGHSIDVIRRAYDRAPKGTTLSSILYAFAQDWLVEDLLMKADKMTMANSLELRVPFLDFRLVEWISRQNDPAKVRWEASGNVTRKVLLRRYARSRLPREIIERPKIGFATPVMEWVARDTHGIVSQSIRRPGAWVRHRFSPRVVDAIARRSSSDRRSAAQTWLLVVLEHWAQRWL